ncbi:MAG: hypothetical protein WC676_08690 [Candidatus Omnitrophota bacterium]
MSGDAWGAGIFLIACTFIIMAIPCIGIGFLGYQMLNKLAHFPSKNSAIQMDIFIWVVMIEFVSVVLLMIAYMILIDSSDSLPKMKNAKNNYQQELLIA